MAFGPLNLLDQACLTNESADETIGPAINVLGYTNLTFYVTGIGTTSSGVITLEEAHINPATANTYAGAWSAITTVNASDVTGGAQKAVHLSPSSYSHVRAHITTVIGGGGTISVDLVAV